MALMRAAHGRAACHHHSQHSSPHWRGWFKPENWLSNQVVLQTNKVAPTETSATFLEFAKFD
ncbi:hypothetical protein [Bradyrhizobium cytisi]|uniref:hypothetical protein n=1 Tax=Bradyrhizobium cytisi TaxID=515489 RepID=UPI0016531160|nr:hypothetical protein [Bradyrhizobium cytisi]